MSITEETRREAYYEAQEDAPSRRKLLYQYLKKYGPMTVDELTSVLVLDKMLPYHDRNFCAPRLTEMKALGLITTNGKRRSFRTGKMTAIWEVVPKEELGC